MGNLTSTYKWIFSVITEACPVGHAIFIIAQDPDGTKYRYIKVWASMEVEGVPAEIIDAEQTAATMRTAGYVNLDHWRVL